MSLSFTVPTYEEVSNNDAIVCTDSTTVNNESVCVWHYDNTRTDLPADSTAVRGVVSIGQNTRGFFPLTREIVVYETSHSRSGESVAAVDELIGPNVDLSSVTVYEAEEAACLLRVFNAAGQWFVSTNQKLDASKSRWTAAKNFREQFQDALMWLYTHSRSDHENPECPAGDFAEHAEFWKAAPELATAAEVEEFFFSTLNTEYGYAFLVRPTVENKNFFVTPPSSVPLVKNVGVFTESGSTLLYNEQVPGIPKPRVVAHPTEPESDDFDLLSWLFNKTQKGGISRQGLMVFTESTHFKLLSHEYYYKAGLRENNTVLYQYIVYNMNLSTVPDSEYETYKIRWQDFKELYGRVWEKDFQQVNDALSDITQELARAYFRRNRPRERDCEECEDPTKKCTVHCRDPRKLHQPEFKMVMDIHKAWMQSEDPDTGRKSYRVFRHPNPNNSRGAKYFQHDEETGMDFHMDCIWAAMYQQEPRNVLQMVQRRIRFGDQWTVYQPDNGRQNGNRRGGGGRGGGDSRQSFGHQRRRMVTKTAARPTRSPAAAAK